MVTRMNAWALLAPQTVDRAPLKLQERGLPSPGAGEVLVKVHACGICRYEALQRLKGDGIRGAGVLIVS